MWDEHVDSVLPYYNADLADPLIAILQLCRARVNDAENISNEYLRKEPLQSDGYDKLSSGAWLFLEGSIVLVELKAKHDCTPPLCFTAWPDEIVAQRRGAVMFVLKLHQNHTSFQEQPCT
nr:replication factor A protein 1-like isoform X2 [Ipomoea batatas]